MRIVLKRPTTKGSSDHFVGDAWIDRITDTEPPSRIRVNVLRFAPRARNAWHVHPEGQTLHVTDGIGRVQSRGGEILEIRAGDTVVTPAGEWHWHGAAPDHFVTHLAIWEGTPETTVEEDGIEPAGTRHYDYWVELGPDFWLRAGTSDAPSFVGDHDENKAVLDAMMDSLTFGAETPGLPDTAMPAL